MDLSSYLDEINHAVTAMLAELHSEHQRLAEVLRELSALTAATEDGYRRADWLALNPDLDDDHLGTAITWDTYFGPDKERFHKKEEAASVEERVRVRQFSVSALSGSILQYARQGIAIQYGQEMKGCPTGRVVQGVPMNELIWYGRNQALHWEEGTFRKPTEELFKKLSGVDGKFGDYQQRSMAYEVLRLLGWNAAADFMADMRLFLPTT